MQVCDRKLACYTSIAEGCNKVHQSVTDAIGCVSVENPRPRIITLWRRAAKYMISDEER